LDFITNNLNCENKLPFTSSKVEVEIKNVGAAFVALREAKVLCETTFHKRIDEIPKDFLSNQQALMHFSLSVCPLICFSAEVLHV